jgi:hypothetical protein
MFIQVNFVFSLYKIKAWGPLDIEYKVKQYVMMKI